MPENIKIGAFVLGAIFLLIAILGGNFKIFGAEVAATVTNRALRFITFILGATLLIVTMLPPASISIRDDKSTETPSSPQTPSPSPDVSSGSEKILSDLRAVNINYSVRKSAILEWLNDSNHGYLNVARECLQIIQDRRLQGEGADLDKIYYYYLQSLGVAELEQDPRIDRDKLRESIRKAYNNKNGAEYQSFEKILL